MTIKEQAEQIISKMNSLIGKLTLSETEENVEVILDLPPQYAPSWSYYIGETLTAGQLVNYNNVKYLVLQTVTPIETQTPDMEGMLAIYKPYQGKYNYNWIYGEHCEVGFTRYYDNILYVATQDPNANIYSPDLVPAIWEEVESENNL